MHNDKNNVSDDFNQWAIRQFGVEHADMDADSPNSYFDLRLSNLYTFLDLQIIKNWVLPKLVPSRRTRPWILDVGAGKGRMTRQFVKIAEHCVAIEPFPKFYEVLVAKCHSINNLKTHQNTLLEYAKVARARFDIVYLSGVLPFLNQEEIQDSMNVIHDLLMPGGLVCIRDFGTENKISRSPAEIMDIAKKSGLIMRNPEEMKLIAKRTGFAFLRWRRAYPVNVPWILQDMWPNKLTKLIWHTSSAPFFFPLWDLLAKLNLPHKENCYFYYLLQ